MPNFKLGKAASAVSPNTSLHFSIIPIFQPFAILLILSDLSLGSLRLCGESTYLPPRAEMKQLLPPSASATALTVGVSAATAALKWYTWISICAGVPVSAS
jgi:hypothetical protein